MLPPFGIPWLVSSEFRQGIFPAVSNLLTNWSPLFFRGFSLRDWGQYALYSPRNISLVRKGERGKKMIQRTDFITGGVSGQRISCNNQKQPKMQSIPSPVPQRRFQTAEKGARLLCSICSKMEIHRGSWPWMSLCLESLFTCPGGTEYGLIYCISCGQITMLNCQNLSVSHQFTWFKTC